ncbi:hypothetical protein LPB67_18460 [Undibacterium sp. Jales W-56]|nr:hypothetical protein [Undibacterium sp. Jales W-56]MCU6435764.1 hypothetical protein [Undibacterium sp. Jales W-56]
MSAPEQQEQKIPPPSDGSPKFGRLLMVLVLAVMLIVLITFVSEAIYSN